MIRERIINLNEGEQFYKNENDARPCTLIFLDLNEKESGGYVAYKHPKLGKKVGRFNDFQSVFIIPPADQAWKVAKEEHGTWKEVANALGITLPTLKKWRDEKKFPQEFYPRYGFHFSKRRKV